MKMILKLCVADFNLIKENLERKWEVYLELEKNLSNRTCMIYFSENKVKLNKEMAKIVSQYKKNKSVTLREVKTTEFSFKKPVVSE